METRDDTPAPLPEPQSREALKRYFQRGSVPTEQHYAALIDSAVNRHDDDLAALARPVSGGTPSPGAALDGPGFVASPGGVSAPPHADRLGIEVPADGQWHPILTGLDGLQAFEIVAAAYGPLGAGRYAVAHATALSAYGKSRSCIRQDNAWFWGFFQKIQFRWTGTLHSFGLEVRTASSFGSGGRIVSYITQLFDDRRPLPPVPAT